MLNDKPTLLPQQLNIVLKGEFYTQFTNGFNVEQLYGPSKTSLERSEEYPKNYFLVINMTIIPLFKTYGGLVW